MILLIHNGLGQSEITLGKALGVQRKNVVVASKFGVRAGNGKTVYDNSPEWIREALHGSLERLGTDYIDLYQIHYRDDHTPISAVVETLEDLQKRGVYPIFWPKQYSSGRFERIAAIYVGKFVSFQDEYSLACRKNEPDMLMLADQLQLTPLTWGSLGQGILTGKYDKNTVFDTTDRRSRDVYVNFHGQKLLKNLEIVEALKKIADRHEKSVASIAIRFILDYLPDSVVLCGAKRPSQIIGNAEAADWSLGRDEIEMLEKISAE